MAELASGAVSSLLGLLRNETLLLSRVGSDVEFIKEEMESMHSFLEHLARTAPPAGGHDEQVRTWMRQVRDLAHDCSNCIDLYLRRGDPAVHRARSGRWRYLWWASWLVQRMVAQHNAAIRLGELKERARDVGTRRLRYGVEIPRKAAAGSAVVPSMPWLSQAAATEEEEEDNQNQASVAADGSDPRQRALEPRLLEEYCAEKLVNWLQLQAETKKDVSMTSIAIVAPDDTEDAGAIAREALTLASANFTCKVWINLSALHLPWDLPLRSSEILSYILRECEQQQGTVQGEVYQRDPREKAYRYKEQHATEIWSMIDDDDINEKVEEIRNKIGEVDVGKREDDEEKIGVNRKKFEESKTLNILLRALRLMQQVPDMGVPLSLEAAMEETASMLKAQMEASKPQIRLDVTQYIDILRKVFPISKPLQPQAHEASHDAITLGEDRIKEITNNHKITLDIIWELLRKQQLLESNSAKKEQATGCNQLHVGHDQASNSAAAAPTKESKEKMKETSGEVQGSSTAIAAAIKEVKGKTKEFPGEVKSRNAIAATINETKEKMDDILVHIEGNLFVKGIVDRIMPHLKNKKTLIILQDDEDYVSTEVSTEINVSTWEVVINSLNILGCTPGSAVIVSTKNSKKAKEFCYPSGEPVTCSLVGLYHDIVLQLTEQRINNENDGYNPRILREILDKCHPHEFCMKIFAHSLYANPDRSYEELRKLHEDLVCHKTLGTKAMKMLKFSYKDLPSEHKTCMLYLAIFPQGHNIRRSTLIGRWVTEGLITKQDWPTAVRHAEQCFDALVKRGLVLPYDVGAAGKVKSCMVGDLVHAFITKIANKEHILDARLSDLWARHFSIFSGLRLRASDGIDKFVHSLPKYSPQLPLLKVLDLEGTNCFDKNQYLKDICNKILLLKYLSLRGTNVTSLPNEINNLHELEVLDIRQTMIPERATRDVLLLKLRRLLADRVDPSSRLNDRLLCYAVQIPRKIEKMENLEILTNVKALGDGHELKDIRNLWQLRKLGVVIEDRDIHIKRLLRAINDLKDCLQSLSITISSNTRTKSTPSSKERQPIDMNNWLRQTPKHLASLSISGATQRGQLFELLAKGSDELIKVTLSGTLFKEDNLMVLAVLPKLQCLRLRTNAYNGSKLTFKEEEFPQLKYLYVEGTNTAETDIKFEDGATSELEKIILSFTNIRSLSGIGNLQKLKELELEGNHFLLSFSQDRASPDQNTESRALERNTDSRALEQNTKSGVLDQNAEDRATEQNIQGTICEQNSVSRARSAPEQNNESRTAEGIAESRAPEQSTENREAKKNTQSMQNSEIRAPNENTDSTATDQNSDSKAVLENTQNRAPEENPKITVPEQTSQSKSPEHNTQSKATEKNMESRLNFKKGKFQHLKYFRVVDSKMTNIKFENGSAPELKKIALSLTNTSSQLIGAIWLPKLKEIELKGDKFLLSFFDSAHQIAKVTLSGTQLKQADIETLAKKRNLRCLVLLDNSYDESQLALNKGEFPKLDRLVVDCPKINKISFTDGSAPKLEKIAWSFTEMKSLPGIGNLQNLKEIECNGDFIPYQVRKDIAAHNGKPVLTHKKPQQHDQAKEVNTAEEDDDSRFPLISSFLTKNKNRR